MKKLSTPPLQAKKLKKVSFYGSRAFVHRLYEGICFLHFRHVGRDSVVLGGLNVGEFGVCELAPQKAACSQSDRFCRSLRGSSATAKQPVVSRIRGSFSVALLAAMLGCARTVR